MTARKPPPPDTTPADTGSLTDEVASGDMRRSLVAVRDALAAELEGGECCTCEKNKRPSNSAAVAKELVDVIARIEKLPKPVGSPLADLTAKRDARRNGAGVADSPAANGGPKRRGARSNRAGGVGGVGA